MNFVTAKELTIALDSLNEWMAENPDLKLTDIRLGKCNEKEVTFRVRICGLEKRSLNQQSKGRQKWGR